MAYENVVVGIRPMSTAPTEFGLDQNFPNPFNPSTTIHYKLPRDTFVTLQVFDVVGRLVKTLVNGNQASGRHEVTFDAGNLSSAVYICRLQAGDCQIARKMVLLK